MRNLALAFPLLLLGACAADVGSDEGVASTGGEQAALHQPPADGPDRLERRLAHMKARLDLTDEQVEQIRPILERKRAERQALRDLPREERREARRALHDGMRAELEGILTPEQLAQADEMFARHQARRGRRGMHGMHGMHGGPGGPGHGPPDPEHVIERMQAHLELTDAQVTQVRPIFERVHERHQALRDMAPEERQRAGEALHAEIRGELAQVLTVEQMQKMDEHMERRGAHFRDGRGEGRRGGRGHHRRGRGEGPGPGGPAGDTAR